MNVLQSSRALLYTVIIAALTGCSSAKVFHVGDARLSIKHRCTAFDLLAAPEYICDLEFSPFSLSERGEHVFKVRGLSTPVFPNDLILLYPVIHPRSISAYRPQWGDARVRVEFRDLTGRRLFSRTVDFATAKFIEDHGRYTRPNFSYNLGSAVAEALQGLTNYDAVVTVVNPTRKGDHFARLHAGPFGFSEMGQPSGAANGSQPIRSETNSAPSSAGSHR